MRMVSDLILFMTDSVLGPLVVIRGTASFGASLLVSFDFVEVTASFEPQTVTPGDLQVVHLQ